MNTDALPEAAEMNPDESWKGRLTSKVRATIDRTLLEEIKASVQQQDPVLDRRRPEFRLPVLLTAAAIVGPDIDRLVSFTHYSRKFVEAVSRRMRACGRWTDAKVHVDHWYDGDKMIPAVFWVDCLVADGTAEIGRTQEGEEWYCAIPNGRKIRLAALRTPSEATTEPK
jgi:hypothetical protein